MKNKVCVVTGANSGIGYFTARELATQGATVVLVCRSAERGDQALQQIREFSGNSDVHLLLCDLSSQASIREFAAEYRRGFERLDVLVNNAGGVFWRRQESVDGIEMTFALNHLGYFLPTLLLLDLIVDSAPARIVNVSSGAHRSGRFDFDDWQRRDSYRVMGAYGESKMANLLFSFELARRLEGSGVTVNALHPGFVRTNFAGNNGIMARLAMAIGGRLFGISAEEGAQTAIYLATSPEVESISGRYFYKKQVKSPHSLAHDREAQRRLWRLSEQLTGESLAEPTAPAATVQES